jgi:hypothetical protein
MDLQTVLPPVILLVGCFTYILWPQAKAATPIEKTRLDYLRERKEAIYENLRDLNFEFRAGKYPEDDYARQRESLETEAAKVVSEMDTFSA